jgi:hypothetical protein
MNIKKIILVVFILLGIKSYSQEYRFKTTSVSVADKLKSGKWDKWSKAQDANLVITLDTKKNRIVIYSEIIQLFEILEYIDVVETKTNDTATFVCMDNEGEDCTLAIITRKNQGNRKQLYVTYDDRILNYNIVNLK